LLAQHVLDLTRRRDYVVDVARQRRACCVARVRSSRATATPAERGGAGRTGRLHRQHARLELVRDQLTPWSGICERCAGARVGPPDDPAPCCPLRAAVGSARDRPDAWSLGSSPRGGPGRPVHGLGSLACSVRARSSARFRSASAVATTSGNSFRSTWETVDDPEDRLAIAAGLLDRFAWPPNSSVVAPAARRGGSPPLRGALRSRPTPVAGPIRRATSSRRARVARSGRYELPTGPHAGDTIEKPGHGYLCDVDVNSEPHTEPRSRTGSADHARSRLALGASVGRSRILSSRRAPLIERPSPAPAAAAGAGAWRPHPAEGEGPLERRGWYMVALRASSARRSASDVGQTVFRIFLERPHHQARDPRALGRRSLISGARSVMCFIRIPGTVGALNGSSPRASGKPHHTQAIDVGPPIDLAVSCACSGFM